MVEDELEKRLRHIESGLGNLAKGLSAAGHALEAIDTSLKQFYHDLAQTRERVEATHFQYEDVLKEMHALADSLRGTVASLKEQAATVKMLPESFEARLEAWTRRQEAAEMTLSDLLERIEALESGDSPH